MAKRSSNLNWLILLLFLFPLQIFGQKVYVLELFDEIHPASARYISRGFTAAREAQADLVLIHMNTYGGLVESADSIRTTILNSKLPTAVFIDKNAASAGALISIACDSIFMAPGSQIGAVTVVSGETGMAMPDKYQSYMRATMRATAEMKGRNPDIAEKMVDQNLVIEGLSPEGTVITFTTSEAIDNGYCEGEFKNLKEVISHYGYENAEVITHESDFIETIIQILIHPAVSGFLVMLIFGGIFMELKTPGFGFAGGVAIVAASLFFAPHYLEGLAQNWEILIFAIGIVLIALEIFVIPGFGVAGISGIVLTVSGLAISLLRNDFMDFSLVNGTIMLQSFAIVLVSMVTSLILVIWVAKQFITASRNFPFVDGETQDKEKGYTAMDSKLLDYIGKTGVALTDLKPAGFVEIDGTRLDAETEGSYLEKGAEVEVKRMRSTVLIVKKK
ncbi:MAG: nodulation protein NfeD [Bacteroidia bacterium]|nr:nodulation protein NfeD [Bacteroidia bacterium]